MGSNEEPSAVSDVVTLARAARESLARGLDALQGDPQVPPPLLALAAPIAQAMGALHQIERSGGGDVTQPAQRALASVQHALAQLQSQPTRHPAVLAAAEAVAGALGNVHALTRAGTPGPGAVAPPAPPVQTAPRPAAAAAPPQAAPPAYAPPPAGPAYASPGKPPVPTRQAASRTAPAAQAPGPAPQAPAGQRLDVPVVTAELGTHSPSNFYKGLSGNDIVEHGGLFVSTYKLPKLGQPVRLKVALPGGYEFEANAVVRWRRESSDAGSDAPPGFGAQFTEITSEARQLVYRYVRNREPMFHDDL
jgi:hypothetical protein